MKELKKLELPSKMDNVAQLENFLAEVSEEAGIPEERKAIIMLALSEAVTNAVIHGNKQDPSKKVFVTASLDENSAIHISVQDEGPGFEPQSLPDPLKEDNLMKPSGRGVFLMKQYADDVSYNDKGNKVTLRFSVE